MQVGNVFGHVCLCVCLSLSVCPSVQTITFEPLDIETSFLACICILTISRSSLSIKIIGSLGQDHMRKIMILLISTCKSSVYCYRSLMRSRSHIKLKVTSRSKYKCPLPFQFYAKFYLFQQIISLCVATGH